MSTIEGIVDKIEDDTIGDVLKPFCAGEMDALVKRAKSDRGAPFENETVARMAATKRTDLAAFMRLRERLKVVGAKVGELDKAVEKATPKSAATGDGEASEGQGRALTFPVDKPWPKPVDGAELLGELVMTVMRYVMLSRESAIAIALWIVQAYCFNAFGISPRLFIKSPEKRCGKTTLLRLIQALVPKALSADNITAAAMFRTIEAHRPTLLIDEADAFMRDNEELRGIINSGHARDGSVIRLVGDDHEPRAFSTYCPTVIAAIGNLAGTIEDRSIIIAMRRRLTSESIERFRADHLGGELKTLRRKAARWTADHEDALREADPDMPEALHDRACDNWRGALAIADLVGEDWPRKACAAAVALSAQGEDQDDQSRGIMLLADIKRVFDAKAEMGGKDADRLSSTDLADKLADLPDRPWATWTRGKPITTNAIARMLRDFHITPNTIRLADRKTPNGYRLAQFDDAFARYLPKIDDPPSQSSYTSHSPRKPGVSAEIKVPTKSQVTKNVGTLNSVQPLEEQGLWERGNSEPPGTAVLEDIDDEDEDADVNFLHLFGRY